MGTGEDLWQQMLRDCSVRTKLPMANLLMVGDVESGKSSLLARIDEAKLGPSDVTDETQAVDALLAYRTLDILDPRAKEIGNDAEDVMARIAAWSLNDLNLKDLIKVAVKPKMLQKTVVAIVVDLSHPWTIKSALEQWLSAIEGELLEQINQVSLEDRKELYDAIKRYILAYEDPSVEHSAPTSMDTSTDESTKEGVLSKNLGVPLVIIVAKSDLRPENSVKMDFIEYTLRHFAIRYGASLVYTSAKTGTNVDLLRKYILHRAYPSNFKFTEPPQLVDHSSIFIPSGYDSFELVSQSLVGSQARWPTDKSFEEIIVAPPEGTDDAATLAADIRVENHDQWLEKLEKAAGGDLEELQKQSIEASKKAEQAAVARRAAADRRKREEKNVSSKHLQTFFNNLLSRPEKTRSSRSMSDKRKEKNENKSSNEQATRQSTT